RRRSAGAPRRPLLPDRAAGGQAIPDRQAGPAQPDQRPRQHDPRRLDAELAPDRPTMRTSPPPGAADHVAVGEGGRGVSAQQSGGVDMAGRLVVSLWGSSGGNPLRPSPRSTEHHPGGRAGGFERGQPPPPIPAVPASPAPREGRPRPR